jgi:predicted flap endonuclease-1-like 5' DNA nuclease
MRSHLRPFSARKKAPGLLIRMVWLGWAATILSLELVVLWIWLRRRSGTTASPEAWEPSEILLPEIEIAPAEVVAPAKSVGPGKSQATATEAPDPLERIEGIGPKVASLLNEAGIRTFAQLAAVDGEYLGRLLRENRLNFINPTTWPEQARLAAGERWQELEDLQKELKGGQRAA